MGIGSKLAEGLHNLPDRQAEASATSSDFKQLLGFFLAQNGALHGFQFRDPDDHSVTRQVIATGNSLLTNFTLVRTLGERLAAAPNRSARSIYRPNSMSISMGRCRFKEDTYDFEKFMDKLWSQR